jgi:hypothetical protein
LNKFLWGAGCAALGIAFAFVPLDQVSAYPAATVPDTIRAESVPSELLIIVPQVEIRSSIATAADNGQGGIVGAIIAGAMDASRAKKTEDKAELVREALDGFDPDAAARVATLAAFSKLRWINTSGARLSKDETIYGKSAILDTVSTPHLVILNYTFELTPDYSGITVTAVAHIVDKVVPKAKKPEDRVSQERMIFGRVALTTASLPPGPPGTVPDYVALWTADNGKLMREALTTGFAKAAELSARTLMLSFPDAVAMTSKDKPKMSIGLYRGRVVEGSDSLATPEKSGALLRTAATLVPGKPGVLIWSDCFVHARVLAPVEKGQ